MPPTMTAADAIYYLRSLAPQHGQALEAAESIEYALSEKTRLSVESDNTQMLNRILRTLRCCGEFELADELRKLNPSLLPQEGLAVLKHQIESLQRDNASERLCVSTCLRRIREAAELAVRYGMIDGSHHKMWVIDQMLRLMYGPTYDNFIATRANNDPDREPWDVGIAP